MSAPAPAVALRRSDLEAGRLEPAFHHVGHLHQPIDIEAARLDQHHLLEVLDHRRLRLLGRGEQAGVGGGMGCGRGAQGEGAGQRDGAQREDG